jgi:hypothetical protein
MKRPPTARLASIVEDEGTSTLAAVVCHELNNIAVPMGAFAELALQSGADGDSVRRSLDEMRIAIDRVKALASDLESLAESDSLPARVAIGDCMPAQFGGQRLESGQIEWQCSAATSVLADRRHARRAIESLAVIASRPSSAPAAPPGWLISQLAAARCVVCGRAAATRKALWVSVQVRNARPVAGEALRDPFGAGRASRAGRRLSLAVLVHSAHHAGGHLVQDEDSGSLSVVFPVARDVRMGV